MSNSSKSQEPDSGHTASYRIQVEGSLSDKWSDRLGGMQIAVQPRDNQKPVSTLSGQVRDQAALFGVLNSLYELHLKILSVECVSPDEHTASIQTQSQIGEQIR